MLQESHHHPPIESGQWCQSGYRLWVQEGDGDSAYNSNDLVIAKYRIMWVGTVAGTDPTSGADH